MQLKNKLKKNITALEYVIMLIIIFSTCIFFY